MSDNSNDELNFQDDESCDHNELCPCCIAREKLVTEFIEKLSGVVQKKGKLSLEALVKVTDDFYTDVLRQGIKEAYEDMIGYAAYQIHGDSDEDIQ